MSLSGIEKDKVYVPFFPIFTVATLAVFLDIVSIILDEAVVGNMFDDTAFGALNLLEPYSLCENFLGYLICVGGTALIMRAHGEGDNKKMNDIFSLCISCCLIVGVFFVAVFTVFKAPLADMVAGETDAASSVQNLLLWERLRVFVEPFYTFLITYVLYMGGMIFCVIALLVFISCNLGLSILLGKSIGLGGVVLATGLSQIVAITILCLFFFVKKPGIRPRFYLNANLTKRIVTISFPESSYLMAFGLMNAVVNAVALKNYDIQGLVVMSVLINAFETVAFFSEGISEYETVAMNEYLGQGNQERFNQCIRTSIRAAIIEGLAFSIMLFVGPGTVASIFDVDDPEALKITVNALRFFAVVPVGICMTRILSVFYQYTERIIRATAILMLSWGVFPALLCFLLGQVSLVGLIIGFTLGLVAILPILFVYVRIIKREKFFDYRLS
jgi:Na+-driven multidrug efflux pump